MNGFRCVAYDDPGALYAAGSRQLASEPAINNVVAANLLLRRDGVVAVEPDGLWLLVRQREAVRGVAMQTPPRGLLLGDMSEAAVDASAAAVSELRPELPGVNGPLEQSLRFAERFAEHRGCTWRVDMRTRLFEVREPVAPTGVPGAARRAEPEDVPLLLAWFDGFAADTGLHERPAITERIDALNRDLELRRPYLLWENGGRPRAMAMESPEVARASRIQAVYTPPEERGKGYASALVAELSTEILSRTTRPTCILYTDLSNPVSNKIYQRIGYRPVVDGANCRFA